MGVKVDTYSTAEFYEQFVNTHAAAVNTLRLRTTNKGELDLEGIIIRKTTSTGGSVPMMVEVFELVIPTSGGSVFNENPSNSDREDNTTPNYSMVENPTVDLTGAKIIFRERGLAERPSASRVLGFNRNYVLKPNTDYIIRSTVESGTDYNVQTVLVGRWVQF